ncbi:MAG: tRNA (adenosine(37)-N6)-threonylcarbamoyltransferase complex ATPase subunit type 1 TsaE [Betaproteobacteria bacterium]|nr:tRNA (adenosine(37)-N6)-threonylcarbamoyltransferase complex ATPase subunit type 1 TsaE [Betaproteobacteria bacterium]
MSWCNRIVNERHCVIVDRHRLDFNSVTEDQMMVFGQALAQLAQEGRIARVYLHGGLGAGKTSLARTLLRALGVEGRIKSPSFAIAETYTTPGLHCAHLDFFRQTDPLAWRDSGLRELLADSSLILVEWPEKVQELPEPDIDLSIDWADPSLPEGPRQLAFVFRSLETLQAFEEALKGRVVAIPVAAPGGPPGTAVTDPVRRSLALVPVAAGLMAVMPRPAQAVEVVAVRVWPAANYTRVAIEHDTAKLFYSTTRLTKPERLVVDLQNMRLGHTLRQIIARITPNDPFIGQVRVGQFKPHVVRMVFDLKQSVRAQVFTLPPIAQYRHRLVIDLYPEVTEDPLLAFLREYEAATAKRGSSGPPNMRSDTPEIAQAPTPSAPTAEPPATATGEPRPSAPSQEARRPPAAAFITIAIDAGHGGEDPGAIGRAGTREKDVVLRIAREMKRQIDARPNMRAFLTRDGDYFVPLARRVALARQVNADLFVSVHADAWVSPTAEGASVFALSEKGASSAAARWMANKENESDSIGGVKLGQIDDLLTQTLLDMSTTAQIKDSLKLGQSVLREIGRINRLHKPQVEQAGFAVLRAPDIPSILVETAFISNPEEERRLRDAAYQRSVAAAIQDGIDDYLARNPPLAKRTRA